MAKELNRIKERADELNLRIQDVADKTDGQVGYKTIYNWINGVYNPKYVNLKAVADTLETTPSYLMGETDTKE